MRNHKADLKPTIELGFIFKNKGTPSERDVSYEIKFLDKSYLDDIISLQDTIGQSLSDPTIFRLHSVKFFKDLFELKRSIIGVVTDEGLIAYSMICLPGKRKENLGLDIKLPENALDKVAHIQAIAVHPSYRGNSLQKKMVRYHLKVLKELEYVHVCCTVSPKNPISLMNMTSLEFVIRGLKKKYHNNIRYIMYKNMYKSMKIGAKILCLKGSDIIGQMKLLHIGYVGFKMEMDSSDFNIYYGLACDC